MLWGSVLNAIDVEPLELHAAHQLMKRERQVPATTSRSAVTRRTVRLSNVDEPSAGTTHLSPVGESSLFVVTPYDKARRTCFYQASTDRAA